IAELVLELRMGGVAAGLIEFSELLVGLVDDLLGVLPVKAYAGGARRDLLGLDQGREGSGGAAEGGLFRLGLVLLFLRLDVAPDAPDVAGGGGGLVAEDVGVASDKLLVDGVEGVVDAEEILLAGQLGVEDGLEEEVAELFGEVRPIAAVDGVEDLVGFLEG